MKYMSYPFLLLTIAFCWVVGATPVTAQPAHRSSDSISVTAPRPTCFPSDEAFLDYIQRTALNYMWEGAEPISGLARERIHLDNIYPDNDRDVVTIGGSGFGIAGLLVGIDRKFINRTEGVQRLTRIVDYLARADRFHGVWPHWLYGPTGKVKPFGKKDNGGDLVESSFLMASLLCVRQYFANGNSKEKALAEKINRLWESMEFSWYTRGGKDVIYWHWSPQYGWEMNFPLEGYNECMIVYVLATASPTYPVSPQAYHKGWARSGGIRSTAASMGYPLGVKHNGAEFTGGPLFWAHYSWIGLDPRNLKDRYADYWQVVRNHAMSNYAYCVSNPKRYAGYSASCWGLTAGYSPNGYAAHSPGEDLGVITPTAALSSFPYTPKESMQALKGFWEKGDRIWGKYGFYDGFSDEHGWTLPRYLAIDQCTIAPMIENYRTGLLWQLFMSCPEIQHSLTALGFTY